MHLAVIPNPTKELMVICVVDVTSVVAMCMVLFGIYMYSTWFENVLGFGKGMVGQIN
jgi:hypothetical protein